MFYLKEAMEIADQSGILSGPSIKSAMYLSKDWVPEGLEGVCLPATWSNGDHRGIARVLVYQAQVREEALGRSMETLIDLGVIRMKQIYEANIPRKSEWLGY
jgi:branched-chain amino acid transport system substrate-binding protein